jgi:hypothetical protein
MSKADELAYDDIGFSEKISKLRRAIETAQKDINGRLHRRAIQKAVSKVRQEMKKKAPGVIPAAGMNMHPSEKTLTTWSRNLPREAIKDPKQFVHGIDKMKTIADLQRRKQKAVNALHKIKVMTEANYEEMRLDAFRRYKVYKMVKKHKNEPKKPVFEQDEKDLPVFPTFNEYADRITDVRYDRNLDRPMPKRRKSRSRSPGRSSFQTSSSRASRRKSRSRSREKEKKKKSSKSPKSPLAPATTASSTTTRTLAHQITPLPEESPMTDKQFANFVKLSKMKMKSSIANSASLVRLCLFMKKYGGKASFQRQVLGLDSAVNQFPGELHAMEFDKDTTDETVWDTINTLTRYVFNKAALESTKKLEEKIQRIEESFNSSDTGMEQCHGCHRYSMAVTTGTSTRMGAGSKYVNGKRLCVFGCKP